MPVDLYVWITDFGDTAVLLPVTVVVLIVLSWRGARQAARVWLGAIVLCVFAVTVLKIVCRTCAPHLSAWSVNSPSGHTAFSVVVYGALTVMFALGASTPAKRVAIAGAGAGSIVAIAATRLLLGFHTISEVAIGAAAGAVALAWFGWRYRGAPAAGATLMPIAIGTLLAALLAHGHRLPAETFLIELVANLRGHRSICA
jgi:membrane-associated phospholipid phosphatase